MTVSLKLAWHDRVSLSAGDGEAIVDGPDGRLALRPVSPEILAALKRLMPPGEAEETLMDEILRHGNAESLARWIFHVDQFRRRGMLCSTVYSEEGPLATLTPLSRSTATSNDPPRAASRAPASQKNSHEVRPRYSLSRFAYLRNHRGAVVVESPLSHARITLHDPRAVVVFGALAAGSTVEELGERIPTMARPTIAALISMLEGAMMIDRLSDSPDPESSGDDLESWDFHDLLFHARSRRGRSDAPFGATYRLLHRPAPAALKAMPTGPSFNLDRPDLARLGREDLPFARVLDERRSIRRYGTEPITALQLGEFLHRVGRVTETWSGEIPGSTPATSMDFAGRPYPAGGALYELEMYPVIRSCRGFAAGMYLYDAAQHRLHLIASSPADVELLLNDAAGSAGVDPQTVQVLIILASRFRRIAWKYESIAYALTLKHVGVVYQTMYLVATAMGLAPCSVGCGDSDLFARAAGTLYHVESSVGEFLLGSRSECQSECTHAV